ncbi:hypothetical protein BH20CHL8_BH20CHL8_03260 [soil metagenome]
MQLTRRSVGGLLVALLGVTYLALAVTAVDLQPPPLGGLVAAAMAVAGAVGVIVSWRFVAGRATRALAVTTAVVLGVLPLVPLGFGLFQWFSQRASFEGAASGVSYAAPGPLIDVIMVPAMITAAALVATVALAASGRQASTD